MHWEWRDANLYWSVVYKKSRVNIASYDDFFKIYGEYIEAIENEAARKYRISAGAA
jgi:hypothetical protein